MEVQCKLVTNEVIYNNQSNTDTGMPKVKFSEYQLLDGRVVTQIQRVADGSVIKRFDKTPIPEKESDVICPHFLELKWANGCNFDCAWCYLNGTFRFRPQKKKPYLKDKEKIIEHLEALLQENVNRFEILNSGELADSLVYEGKEFSLSQDIIPLFKKYHKHKLLVLTKSTNIKGVLASDSQDVVIPSFSLNAYCVSERWERNAPHPRERIKAAQELYNHGYHVRVRIDPMVPVENWRDHYLSLVDEIFNHFVPERITLGSLRGLQSTINNSPDKSWVDYLSEKSNWGKKIDSNTRYDMFKVVIDHLTEKYNYSSVGLCKETKEIWKRLNMDFSNIKCNCIW